MYESQLAKENQEKEREKKENAQAKFDAINMPEWIEEYKQYREMKRRLTEKFWHEDYFLREYGRMPSENDPQYRELKMKLIIDPDFRFPVESGY